MSPDDIGNLIQFAMFLAVVAGGFYAMGRQSQRINDLERARGEDKDIAAETKRQEERLLEQTFAQQRGQIEAVSLEAKAAMTASGEVRGLASAVEHLTASMGEKFEHLTELVSLQLKTIGEQATAALHEARNAKSTAMAAAARRTRQPRTTKES